MMRYSLIAASVLFITMLPARAGIFDHLLLSSGANTPIPIGISPLSSSAPDTLTVGSQITSFSVTMSDGSAFAGTITRVDPNNLVNISGNTLIAATTYTSGNDGTYTNITVQPCQLGKCLRPQAFTLLISSSFSCAYGGPAPSIPDLANKMGFTACILYADFTTMTPSQFAATINCATNSPSNPIFYLLYGPENTAAPCSNATLMAGVAADIKDDLPNTHGEVHITPPVPISFGHFAEATWRYPSSTYANSDNVDPFNLIGSLFNYTSPPGTTNTGADDLEVYCGPPAGCTIAGSINANDTNFAGGNAGNSGCCFNYWPGLDMSIYHKVSSIDTTDAISNAAICTYIDQVSPSNCATVSSSDGYNSTFLTKKMGVYFTIGPNIASFSPHARGPYDVYLQKFQLWACPNWATAGCPTAVQTTPPPY